MTTTEHRSRLQRALTSIRVRIVIGYVLLLAAALLIATVVIRQVLLSQLDREIDRALAQEIEELRLLADGVDPSTGQPFGGDAAAIFETFMGRSVPADHEAFYAIVDEDFFLASFEAPTSLIDQPGLIETWAATSRPTRGSTTTAEGPTEYLAVPVLGGDSVGVFVVAYFPTEDREEITQIIRIIAVAGTVVLLATAALAWSLAGRVLRPARQLTETARTISETDLSSRIPVTGDDELAELGATFNAMLDRLEEGFRSQRIFLDDVAHELRTPLTILRGHLELLGDDPDERAEAVAVMTDELDRMNRYVDDLLLLAKAEESDFLRIEPVDVGDLAESFLQRAGRLGDRSWEASRFPAPGMLAIEADPGRLLQALLNLAVNAVQHTTDGDQLELTVDQLPSPAGTITFAVSDSGPGVDPDTIDQLFERQFRGAANRARTREGMGIGLSIVDAVARAHGGSADVRNRPTGGACFTITVPVEHHSPSTPEASPT